MARSHQGTSLFPDRRARRVEGFTTRLRLAAAMLLLTVWEYLAGVL